MTFTSTKRTVGSGTGNRPKIWKRHFFVGRVACGVTLWYWRMSIPTKMKWPEAWFSHRLPLVDFVTGLVLHFPRFMCSINVVIRVAPCDTTYRPEGTQDTAAR